MTIEAKLNYLRISPRKVRLVADLVRGRSVSDAEKVLQFTIKRSADPVLKLLKSAVANAENNFGLKKENLYVSEMRVDGGPIIKRFRPRARGAVAPIQKKTSHVSIVLEEREGGDVRKKGKKEKIKKVYQTEKPKEEVSSKAKEKRAGESDEGKSSRVDKKPVPGKTQIFRRKSI